MNNYNDNHNDNHNETDIEIDEDNQPEPENLDGIHALPNETAKAFQCFGIFRDSGGTLTSEQLSHKVSAKASTIRNWSSKHKWQERVENYMAAKTMNRDETVLDEAIAELYFAYDIIKPIKKDMLLRIAEYYDKNKHTMDMEEIAALSKMFTQHTNYWEEISGLTEVAAILNKRNMKDLK